ncbi:MAG: kelch motif-containing protein [Thermoplasmata archaeon]|nr:kelch motif-containing protein [Thermoplasmata archaeon]
MRAPSHRLVPLALVIAVGIVLSTSFVVGPTTPRSPPPMRTAAAPAAVAHAAVARPYAADVGWTNMEAAGSVPGLFYPSLAYDALDGYLVLFGGCGGVSCSNPSNSTWVLQDGAWTQLHPAVSPAGRQEAQMAYDAADGYVLLFGGDGAAGGLHDTWSFANGIWTELTPGTNPGARVDANLVYDAVDGYSVLFGGYACVGTCGTWIYSHSNWTQLNLSVSPSDRYAASMVYSPAIDKVVLFGGAGASGGVLADTWEFSAGTWTQFGGAGPALRSDAEAGYDATLGAVVLFGGWYITLSNFPGVDYDDTWEFGSAGWSQALAGASPPPLTEGGMAFDGASGSVVEVGGCASVACPSSTTWVFGATATVTLVAVPPTCGAGSIGGSAHGATTITVTEEVYPFSPSPCAHYSFQGSSASGDVSTGGTPPWVNVSGNGTLTADYLPQTYEVRVLTSPASCGSVEIGNVSYASGHFVNLSYGSYNLSASACGGEVFDEWTTNGSELSVPDSLVTPANLSLGSNGTLTAVFAPVASLTSSTLLGVPLLGWIAVVGAVLAAVAVGAYLRMKRPPPGPPPSESPVPPADWAGAPPPPGGPTT